MTKEEGKNKVLDIDGNEYPTIQVANQLWMAANLKVRHFSNGDPIPECRDTQDYVQAGLDGQPAWCFYDNDSANGDKYGALYNWYAAHDPRSIAPQGWRLPTERDWDVLWQNIRADQDSQGLSFKAFEGASPKSELAIFHPQHGGSRGINGAFGGLKVNAYFWSYIHNPPEISWGRRLAAGKNGLEKIDSFQRFGFSVRCIKDEASA